MKKVKAKRPAPKALKPTAESIKQKVIDLVNERDQLKEERDRLKIENESLGRTAQDYRRLVAEQAKVTSFLREHGHLSEDKNLSWPDLIIRLLGGN